MTHSYGTLVDRQEPVFKNQQVFSWGFPPLITRPNLAQPCTHGQSQVVGTRTCARPYQRKNAAFVGPHGPQRFNVSYRKLTVERSKATFGKLHCNSGVRQPTSDEIISNYVQLGDFNPHTYLARHNIVTTSFKKRMKTLLHTYYLITAR